MDPAEPSLPEGALRAWFLGPRGENAELLERLILESLRDHVSWRRNHHPEDGFTIREEDRRHPGYGEAVTRLTEELHGLLAALKQDVPFFSGRYQGHMLAEQTIASQVGYLAGMLYNPNNVVAEASPVTTSLELEAAGQLAKMIGYPRESSWGHLTSGGTVANFEALWIARGIRYLPVGLAMAAKDLGVSIPARSASGANIDLRESSLWELLNIPPADSLDAYDSFHRMVSATEAEKALDRNSLSSLGYQDYTRRLSKVWSDPLPASVVLVSSTAHYSWEKIVRALGIGATRLVKVPVDSHARMDIGALEDILDDCQRSRTAILAVVSVCGTTEEGAVDRVDLVAAARKRAEQELGTTFQLHVDACFGGYAAAITRDDHGRRLSAAEIQERTAMDWPDSEWVGSIIALADVDSVSIDPHKLGYVPYPAGVFLLRDKRGRNLVSLDPPYLAPAGGESDEGFIGRWILEGSKPGAAAASVWLSHRVIPLNIDGYGHLLARSAAGARRLHSALGEVGALGDFRAVRLASPDLNVVCFLLSHDELASVEEMNKLNEAVYSALSPSRDSGQQPDHWVTRTRLGHPDCLGIVGPLLGQLPSEGAGWEDEGVVVLRCTVMDPFFVEGPPTPDHCSGLVGAIRAAAEAAIQSD